MGKLSQPSKDKRSLILKWRRFLGLCVGCGAEAFGNAMCDRCQAKATARNKARRKKNKWLGICQECGNRKANCGGYRCDGCLELMRTRQKKYQCHTYGCYKDVAKYSNYCKDCLDSREAKKQSCSVYFIECSECHNLFTSNRHAATACYACNKYKLNRLSKERHRLKKGLVLLTKTCAYYRCDNIFKTYNNKKTTCSKLCSRRMIKRNEHQRRRAIKRGAKHIEKVDIRELFLRDQGRCQLCYRKLNLKRKVPHPLAATTDHIVPLGIGGEHSYRNTQLACFMCNSTKSDGSHPGGEQILLF